MLSLKKIYDDTQSMRDGREKFSEVLNIVDEYLEETHVVDQCLYDDLKMDIYVCLNGPHFNEDMLMKAYSHMVNDNNTLVPQYDLRDVEKIMQDYGIRSTKFNLYDFAYVLNSMYADYCQVIGDDDVTYIELAKKFLMDKDGPEGKAFIYWKSMREADKRGK